MNKPKRQGTAFETWVVSKLREQGFTARRLAEGGSLDEGDVELMVGGTRWVLEAKARSVLQVQATLASARAKAGGGPVAVVWKRLVRKAGVSRRAPVAGEPVVVVLGWDEFVSLIKGDEGQ